MRHNAAIHGLFQPQRVNLGTQLAANHLPATLEKLPALQQPSAGPAVIRLAVVPAQLLVAQIEPAGQLPQERLFKRVKIAAWVLRGDHPQLLVRQQRHDIGTAKVDPLTAAVLVLFIGV